MFKRVVSSFYTLLFEEETSSKEVPYGNKLFMFFFSLIAFLVVVFLIGKDIAENIANEL